VKQTCTARLRGRLLLLRLLELGARRLLGEAVESAHSVAGRPVRPDGAGDVEVRPGRLLHELLFN
jgi:hypothetical protein